MIKLTVEVIKLILNSKEHHLPVANGVVVVPLNYATSNLVAILLPSEEVKVC